MNWLQVSLRQYALVVGFVVTALFWLAVMTPGAGAQTVNQNLCGGADLTLTQKDAKCKGKDIDGDGVISESEKDGTYAGKKIDSALGRIINFLSVIIGVLAVIFVVVGGFKYITSNGDSGKIASAKSTIIYALIGALVVAIAQLIVKFVIGKVSS